MFSLSVSHLVLTLQVRDPQAKVHASTKDSSSVLVTNNLSSITALPAPAPKSCGGCTIYEGLFEFLWYSEVYTHTAATVVKFVNNSTNVTRTSTIYGTDFVLPESAGYAANLVPGRVITTEIGDMNHTLYGISFGLFNKI